MEVAATAAKPDAAPAVVVSNAAVPCSWTPEQVAYLTKAFGPEKVRDVLKQLQEQDAKEGGAEAASSPKAQGSSLPAEPKTPTDATTVTVISTQMSMTSAAAPTVALEPTVTALEEPKAAQVAPPAAQEAALTSPSGAPVALGRVVPTAASAEKARREVEDDDEVEEIQRRPTVEETRIQIHLHGQGFTTADFQKVCTSSLAFNDLVTVQAKAFAYRWPEQLDALTKEGGSSLRHGLGSCGAGQASTNLSWMAMGFDRKAETWSENQRFSNPDALTTAQRAKARRLLEPVRGVATQVAASVRSATTSETSASWQQELRLSACTMVETFLRLCSDGFLLHGPMLGYVRNPATVSLLLCLSSLVCIRAFLHTEAYVTGGGFRKVSGLVTMPQDAFSYAAHVTAALDAIEDSLQKQGAIQPQEQDVRGLQLQTATEYNLGLMSQNYSLKANSHHWENWEKKLPPGFSSAWNSVLTSSRFELKYDYQLQNTEPAAWCFLRDKEEGQLEVTSWWFVGNQQYLFQLLRTSTGIEFYKVPGVTVDRPLVRQTFEVGEKEKVTGTSTELLGDMNLVSGLFHEARSQKLVRTEPMKLQGRAYFLHMVKQGTRNDTAKQNIHMVRMSNVPTKVQEAPDARGGRRHLTIAEMQVQKQTEADNEELQKMRDDDSYRAKVVAEAAEVPCMNSKSVEVADWYNKGHRRRPDVQQPQQQHQQFPGGPPPWPAPPHLQQFAQQPWPQFPPPGFSQQQQYPPPQQGRAWGQPYPWQH